MSEAAIETMPGGPVTRPHMDSKPHIGGAIGFFGVLLAGLGYAAYSIATDVDAVGEHNLAIGALVMLGLALLIALGFEFVNGFHVMWRTSNRSPSTSDFRRVC